MSHAIDSFPAEALAFFRDFLRPATLTKRTFGAYTQGAYADGPTTTTADHVGLGLMGEWRQETTELVKRGDRVVILFAGSLDVVPASQDRVTIEGTVYEITGVLVRDAGSATYTCAVKGA